jgi:hypothetical protein
MSPPPSPAERRARPFRPAIPRAAMLPVAGKDLDLIHLSAKMNSTFQHLPSMRPRLVVLSHVTPLAAQCAELPDVVAAIKADALVRSASHHLLCRYPLPSSVMMTACTARAAGVKMVWVASPHPDKVCTHEARMQPLSYCASGSNMLDRDMVDNHERCSEAVRNW